MDSDKELAKSVGKAVGRSLALARKAAGLTQRQLAKASQGLLSRSALANVESGRQRLGVHQLLVLAEVIGIEAVELLPSGAEVGDILRDMKVEDERLTDPKVQEWLRKVEASGRRKAKKGANAPTPRVRRKSRAASKEARR